MKPIADQVTLRRAGERGRTEWGWLDSRHTFSFGEYHDAAQMGFGALRVINDDRVEAGRGFGEHGHRDAEIFSYVIEGALEHRDSLGNGSVVREGNLQYMSAGSGVRHSEFNASKIEPVHFLQVWILPDVSGAEPRYGEIEVRGRAEPGRWLTLFAPESSPEIAMGALSIRQDARVAFARIEAGQSIRIELAVGRRGWLQVVRAKAGADDGGGVRLSAAGSPAGAGAADEIMLAEGDGVAVTGISALTLTANGRTGSEAEVLWFDLR